MNHDNARELQELNELFGSKPLNTVDMDKLQRYMSLVREAVEQTMKEIVTVESKTEKIKILQSIFPLQYHLMGIRLMTDCAIPDDLWEIACDFDNDNPDTYEYLLGKIENRGYLLQSRDDGIKGRSKN